MCALVPVWGWLQGEGRFVVYAGLTVGEVSVRLVASVGAVLFAREQRVPSAGYAAGAVAVLALASQAPPAGPVAGGRTFSPSAARWEETGQIALVQLVLSSLVAADVLAAAFSRDGATDVAGYQALSTLAKAPVYVAAGTVLRRLPAAARRWAGCRPSALRAALVSFRRIALLAAVVLATVPAPVAAVVLPTVYLPALGALPWLAVAGLAYSTTIVLATLLVAARRWRRCRAGLGAATVLLVAGLLVGHALDGVTGLSVGAAVAAAAGALTLAGLAAPVLPRGFARATAADITAAALVLVVLLAVRPVVLLWFGVVLVCAVGVSYLLLGRPASRPLFGSETPTSGWRSSTSASRTRRCPGRAAVRSAPTRSAVASPRRTTLTVLVQRFPGCVDRVQDGVRYVHVGIGSGRTRLTRVLGYMLMLPLVARRCPGRRRRRRLLRPGLLDSGAVVDRPADGGRCAVAQCPGEGQRSTRCRCTSWSGSASGGTGGSVAVSKGIEERLRAVNPDLIVDVIGNGVPAEAFDEARIPGDDIVFVGRLETAQKGLDLLLPGLGSRAASGSQARWSSPAPDRTSRPCVLLPTSWPSRDRVHFVGWVSGRAKFALLASARLVAVPSRFETFGIVALEAAATGTPVVAFDIDCLREVVPAHCGRRVNAFDVDAYAEALVTTHDDTAAVRDGISRRRAFARGFDWDAAASRQEQVYRAVAGRLDGRL